MNYHITARLKRMDICIGQLISNLLVGWHHVRDFASSNFFTTISGTIFAAYAGAFGAQKIIQKSNNKEILLKEIRNTNAAIMVAFTICNFFLGLKKQHVKSLKDNFDKQKEALIQFQQGFNLGIIQKGKTFHYTADFETIPISPVPVDVLQTLVFEKISVNGRPLSLTVTLNQTAAHLADSIKYRNQLIEKCRANSPLPEDIKIQVYFGMPDKNGHIDNSYPSTIEAIYHHTDSCIYFSALLCQDLIEHGEKIRKIYVEKYSKHAPTINKPDFTQPEKDGLMPNSKDYEDWINMFKKKGE